MRRSVKTYQFNEETQSYSTDQMKKAISLREFSIGEKVKIYSQLEHKVQEGTLDMVIGH